MTSRSPRILQVVLSLGPGGTERLVIDLVTRLHAQMPTAVCCLDESGAWGDELRRGGFEITALSRKPGFQPMIGRAIASAARRHGATVIHAHQYTPFVYSCLSRIWHRAPAVVFTEHGRLSDAPASGKRRAANRVFGRIPARTCAVSADLKRFMTAEGFRADAISVIYNGIEPGDPISPDVRAEVRAELKLDPDTFVVGAVARLDPVKSLETLITAVAEHDSRAMALIVGDGPERAALERAAAESGAASRIRFLGYRADARRCLAACDAYVNCSTSEGVSLTILEAMAAALPVIVTAVGGTPEVVTPECGLLIPPRDPSALAEAIRTLQADPAGARARGLAARARVEHVFSIERMVNDYADVYRAVS